MENPEIKKPFAPNAATHDEINLNPASASVSTGTVLAGTATIADGAAALTAKQRDILTARGIDVELAGRMGWRSARQGGSGDAIDIPYFRKGREVNCKTRTLSGEKRFHQVAGGDKCLWNVDILADLGDRPLVICEGEMDAMIALQCGYMAVSVPDGAPKEAVGDRESVKYDYLADIPKGIGKIILAVDSDNPGTNLLHDLSIRLGKHRCLWVQYPQGCKDLNDAFLRYGERGVHETLKRAQYLKIEGLYKLKDLPPIPMPDAVNTFIPALDAHFRVRRGDFSVMTGIPSHGKTTLTNLLLHNLARHHGWNACIASFEQPPQTEFADNMRTLFCAKPHYRQTPDERKAADAWMQERFSFIVPDDESDEWADLDWMLERAAAAVTQHNVSMLVIDPWNEMDHLYDQRETTITQYTGLAIKRLKRFARRYMVHVMVVAHPKKLMKGKDGLLPIPTLYDISDSQHWYNKADQALVVHRLEEDKTLIRVAKSRYHNKLGKPGDVHVRFNDYNGTYDACE